MEVLSVQTGPTLTPAASFSAHRDTHSVETTAPPAKAAKRGAAATVCAWVSKTVIEH